MVVIERIAVVAGVVAHQSAPTVVAGEEHALLAGGEGVPVDERDLELVTASHEVGAVVHLACHHHVERHLRQTLAAPIGIVAERLVLGLVGNHRRHLGGVERIGHVGGVGRYTPVRQHAVEVVVNLEVGALGHLQQAVRRGIGEPCKGQHAVVARIAVLMGQKALQHPFRPTVERLALKVPERLHLPLPALVGPRDGSLAGNGIGIGRQCGKVGRTVEHSHDNIPSAAVECQTCLAAAAGDRSVRGQIDAVVVGAFSHHKL